jgi:ATP-dependent protease ClpP protease subunit
MAETFNDYPKAASANAQRAIDYKEENDDKGGCGTQVGWVRARQLADRKDISFDTVKRMANFQRFKQYKDDPYEDTDGQANCGRIMWDAWGGTEGVNWAINKVEQVEKQRENKTELYLDKPVGQGVDPWTGEEMMSMEDIKANIGKGEDLKLILKSPGGSVIEGFAMADMLAAHGAEVEIIGTGIVGSIATMIFAAGTKGKRKLTNNAFFMIHKPSSGIGGTADDLRSEAKILDTMDSRIVSNYVDLIESNDKLINGSREETADQVRAWMAEEKWFSAQEAVVVGLADGIAEGDYMTEQTARSFAAMAKNYKNTPAQFTNYINKFDMQNDTELPVEAEESKSFLSKFMNHMKAFFTGQKAEAEAMYEDDDKKEDSIIENKTEEMKKENMSKEELLKMAEDMGFELVEVEEKEEEMEDMTKEDILALAESMGMKEKEEEAKAIAVVEQTNTVDEVKALKEELARMKAQAYKSKTQAIKGRKEDAAKTNRDKALDNLTNNHEGFGNAIVTGLGSYFGK